jgi:hypothetical protein
MTPVDDRGGRLRRSRKSGGLRWFLRKYRFELLWLVVVALGLFLLVEQVNLRQRLTDGFIAAAVWLLSRFRSFDNRVVTWLEQVSLSDVSGAMLVLAAITAVLLRVRVRLLSNPRLTLLRCPDCGGSIHRIHRHTFDRLLGLYVPVRRYRCQDLQCGWRGLRVGTGRPSRRPPDSTGSPA